MTVPSPPPYAVAWSGGKDSTHALHRALRQGYRVTHLFNVYEASSGRVRFHGIRKGLIAAQARSLGLELVQEASGGSGGFEEAFSRILDVLEERGIRGLVFGNVHLTDIREWYEARTRERGLEHVEPLWGEDPHRLVRGYLTLGYRSFVTSVNLECGDPSWLGRELTPGLLNRMSAGGRDPCGERGEYHTFTWDGPRFSEPVRVRRGDAMEREGHRFLDLAPATPADEERREEEAEEAETRGGSARSPSA